MSERSHTISRTIDWTDGEAGTSVATCACGWTHREPRFGIPGNLGDPDIVRERRAASERMDAAIAAHWQAEGIDPGMKGGR